MTTPPPLVLASSSPYRKQLLRRLQVPFTTQSPNIDETIAANETPNQLVQRLAAGKAHALATQHSQALIIGSDQVAVLDDNSNDNSHDKVLGKPGTREKAIEQLAMLSGNTVAFLTGLCLLNTDKNRQQIKVCKYTVHFRSLTMIEIERYVDKESPLDCAGSFKSEGLGITLFQGMSGSDPNSLIGLPLIELCAMLRNEGWSLP